MAKNIVVCCDGTGNEFGDDNSNVVKLCSSLVIDPDVQISYYHPGVGTMGSPIARGWLEKKVSVINGLAFGGGIIDRIADAYRYLMETYEPDDRIFLFGFSRGAYTVRALGALLNMYGLLHRGNEGLIPYMTAKFATHTKQTQGMAHAFEVAEGFKLTYSQDVLLHFVGVWDTVSSVGWITDPVVIPYTAVNPIMKVGRHAVSIDERRCFFRDNLWGRPFGPEDPRFRVHQDIKQVWFAGVHSDVGGSYPEGESGLSKITLEWMLREATSFGLRIDDDKAKAVLGLAIPAPFVRPDPTDGQHESLTGPWWIAECLPHYKFDKRKGKAHWTWPPLGTSRHFPDLTKDKKKGLLVLVHESVRERWDKVPAYRPKNLPPRPFPPGIEWEPWVPLFPDPPVLQATGEERFTHLAEAERVQAILNLKVDANPLFLAPPDMWPRFAIFAAVLAVAATLLAPPKGEHWFIALLEIVVLWLMLMGFRKLYRSELIKHYSENDAPPPSHPAWKATYQFAAGLFAAGVVLFRVPPDYYPWLAAALAGLVLVAVGLLSAIATLVVARAYNALRAAWEDASRKPEFLNYQQAVRERTQPRGKAAAGGAHA